MNLEELTADYILDKNKFIPNGKYYNHRYIKNLGLTVHIIENYTMCSYRKDNQLHNPDPETPAVLRWYNNGQLASKEYRQNGDKQNPDSETPALREWYENGQLAREEWWENGKWHDPKPNKPAYRAWTRSGQLTDEWYYDNGVSHDPNPHTGVLNTWHEDGQVKYLEYQNRLAGVFRFGLSGLPSFSYAVLKNPSLPKA